MIPTPQLSLFAPAPALGAHTLRPYQEEAVAATEAYWALGKHRALIALPTGGGKTTIFTAIVDRNHGGRRVLVIAHREELLDQAAERIAAGTALTVGIEQAGRKSGAAQVVVASIQTLMSRGGARRPQPEDVGLVVVDECHHGTARTYLDVLAHYGLAPAPDVFSVAADEDGRKHARDRRKAIDRFVPPAGAPLLLGVTATPNRSDGVGLEAAFDEVVYSKTIRDLIGEGWLCEVRGVTVQTKTDLSGVHTTRGDFNEGELEDAINNPARNAMVVSAYLTHAEGRQALCFAAGVQHAEDLHNAFLAHGVQAVYVTGTTPTDERRAIVAAYKAGRIQVLCNCGVYTEGFDAPATGCIVLARPTKSATLLTQMVGRGTRIAPGKPDLVVIDVMDVYSGTGLASVNALFGLPPRFKEGDGSLGLSQLAMRFERECERLGLPLAALGTAENFADMTRLSAEIDPLKVAALDPVLRAVARYTWLTASWGYCLAVPPERGENGTGGRPGGQLGIVVNQLGQATVRWKPRNEPPVTLERTQDAEDAIRWAEQWVDREHGQARAIIDGAAPWRKRPASEKQIAFAKRLKVRLPEGATAGQASALIDQEMARRGDNGGRRR